MRVIGAGLAVFLAVTAILLYQVSSGGKETAATDLVPASGLTVVDPTPTAPAATATQQPTQVIPTATAAIPPATATATLAPTQPAVADTTEVVTEESPVVVEDPVETAAVEDDLAVEPEYEPETAHDLDSSVHLAATDPTDAWSGAIETPNGGRIGTVLSGVANVRAFPAYDAEVVDTLHAGWPVAIYGVVTGDWVDGTDVWYQVSGGGYISSALIGPYIPRTPETYHAGHWVDVDLSRNIAVAYIDDVPVNAVVVITGKAGFETPVGDHTIFARVENETLDSATVGIPEGDPEYYYLPDVPYTQYFATGGFAIHANYWSDPWQFGTSTSHGCVNMTTEDAAWFWWFLDVGSVVSVSY